MRARAQTSPLGLLHSEVLSSQSLSQHTAISDLAELKSDTGSITHQADEPVSFTLNIYCKLSHKYYSTNEGFTKIAGERRATDD